MRANPKLFSWALGAGVLALFFGRLAEPGTVLALRDVPLFHLPLRTAFSDLAAQGLPAWNPLLHGGQPVLSNPNYAAFYPPTWIGLVAPPHLALQLVLLLHAALGLAGAWRLARHFGCQRPAAAWTALAFTGSGAFVSIANGITMFCGQAWLPWILTWGDRLLAAEDAEGKRLVRLAAPPAIGLALQLFAGEPTTVLVSGLALLCMAVARPAAGLRRAPRLLLVAALAIGLAAAQLLPTAVRVAESQRGAGLAVEEAASWSMPPQRLLEWLSPRFYGDPMRADEDLYFGWQLNDGNFPYVISVYPGLLVLLLGATAALRWRVPRRWAWLAMLGVGLFLALGRHNPLYPQIVDLLPFLQALRFPEKFVVLATSALAFSSGLAWNHLLARRREGKPKEVDLALALAVVVTGLAAVFWIVLALRPAVAEWWVRQQTVLISPERLTAAGAFLRAQCLAALALAALAALVLWLHRDGRLPTRWLIGATLAVLTLDLAYYSRGLLQTLPADELLRPTGVVAELDGATPRLFTDVGIVGRPPIARRSERPGADALWAAVDRLDPYVGNLWGISYALHSDFDRMLTSWGRFGLEIFYAEAERPQARAQLLDAWSVEETLSVVPADRLLREKYGDEWPSPVDREVNDDALARFRFVPRLQLHPDRDAARAGARRVGYWLAEMEHFVEPSLAESQLPEVSHAYGQVVEVRQRGRTLRVRYRAQEPGILVAAVTFDAGWRAAGGGRRLPTSPTGIGQLGVRVPAGEHWLELRYWDHWVTLGLAITLLTLVALVAKARNGRARIGP